MSLLDGTEKAKSLLSGHANKKGKALLKLIEDNLLKNKEEMQWIKTEEECIHKIYQRKQEKEQQLKVQEKANAAIRKTDKLCLTESVVSRNASHYSQLLMS